MADNDAKVQTNETRINSLERRVDIMEDEIHALEKSQGIIGVYLDKSNEIQEKSNIIQKELSDAIVSIQIALGKFSSDLHYSIQKTEEIGKGLNEFKREVRVEFEQMGRNVDTIEDKGKFDFVNFIREKAIPSLLGGGVIWAIYEILEMLVLKTQ